MDLFKGMKGPSRPAPSVPQISVNRYSPVTNWNDDPFGIDVFEPAPQVPKKVPPPRPPPPKVMKPPDLPTKPSHFLRKPTVLSSLLSRKKSSTTSSNSNQTNADYIDVDTNKVFPKCDPKNIQIGTLIDFYSPPSSPTFTTRSSSDGLSVDSFGSDATTSTNHQNHYNGGNASQGESGFEDDFDLFLNSRRNFAKDDTLEDLSTVDPFSPPQSVFIKPPVMKKPIIFKDIVDTINSNQLHSKGPTIIRAKPARPKLPENSALLKNTFSNLSVSSMSVNTTTPIQQVSNSFGGNFDSKYISWDSSPEREPSPPMPTVPPPPPPVIVDEDLPVNWSEDAHSDLADLSTHNKQDESPYGVAMFDYFTDHPEDLCFTANSKINLIRRIDGEWLYGNLDSGAEGIFPSNYVDVKIPLPNETVVAPSVLGTAKALFDFIPAQPGDLKFLTGDTITVLYKVSPEWYYGQCNGLKGQFPSNYVEMC